MAKYRHSNWHFKQVKPHLACVKPEISNPRFSSRYDNRSTRNKYIPLSQNPIASYKAFFQFKWVDRNFTNKLMIAQWLINDPRTKHNLEIGRHSNLYHFHWFLSSRSSMSVRKKLSRIVRIFSVSPISIIAQFSVKLMTWRITMYRSELIICLKCKFDIWLHFCYKMWPNFDSLPTKLKLWSYQKPKRWYYFLCIVASNVIVLLHSRTPMWQNVTWTSCVSVNRYWFFRWVFSSDITCIDCTACQTSYCSCYWWGSCLYVSPVVSITTLILQMIIIPIKSDISHDYYHRCILINQSDQTTSKRFNFTVAYHAW